MALTPEEIVSYDLKQSVRGYAIAQVDDLLDQLADQVEAANTEIERLQELVRRADGRAAEALETEATLKRTLVTAQQTAERAVAEAEQHAAELVDRAREEATDLLASATEEAEGMRVKAREDVVAEVEQARRQRAAIEERIDSLATRERRHRERLRRELEQQLADLRVEAEEADRSWAEADDTPPGQAQDSSPAPSSLTVRVRGTGAEEAEAPLGSATPHDDS
jgi:cell division initiation protein